MAEAGCFSAGLAFCGVRGGLSVLPPTACLAVNSPPRAGQARFALMMCDGSRETAEEAALRRGGGRGTKGLYVRPSKALEVGGGFYVPGLEGYRLRVAIVGLVFTLLTLNRLLLPGFKPQTTQVVSESITALTALFVLAQALLDATFKGGGKGVEESNAEQQEQSAPAGSKLNSPEVYVDDDVGGEQRQRLAWLVSAALQNVQAGSCVLVVGTRSRVAAAGAGIGTPSSDQVQAALEWMSGQGGAVKMISRGDDDGSQHLFASFPGSASQALVAVANDGDLAVVVGLRASRPEWRDTNEQEWLRVLADMP